MAGYNSDFSAVSGKLQSAEPAAVRSDDAGEETGSTIAPRRSPARHASVPGLPPAPQLLRQSSSTRLAGSPSAGPSPQASRTTSPVRKDSRPSSITASIATQPSAAAIQRALSATSVPQLPAGPVSEAVSRLPRSAKSTGGGSGDSTPQWPSSPRLKSPPPSALITRRGPGIATKLTEPSAQPSINVISPTPQTTSAPQILPKPQSDEMRKLDQQLQASAKAPSRGPSGKSTLETVQENSSDAIETSPAALQAAADLKPVAEIEERAPSGKSAHEATKPPGESGSESAGNRSDSKRSRRQSASQSSTASSKPRTAGKSSFSGLATAKSRHGDGKPNMTVETETVASIPQSAMSGLGDRGGMGRGDANGSLRLKPSNETIRPKKERKKASQKSRSINQGTASSKADIFEARVANAVDEANTSDSDETFVYESNPPEPVQRSRHHSRTPSVTSSHSTAEQRGVIRNLGDMLDDRKVAGKRSMKFSSNQHHDDSPDSKTGTVRSHHARHIGKFGRSGAHSSVRESDSPFTHASKPRSTHLGSMTSRPHSPRSPNPSIPRKPSGLFTRKHEQSFDFDGEGADDERTPLMGSMRTPRGARHPQRLHSGNSQQGDDYYGVPTRSRSCRGFSGCCLFVCVVVGVAAITILLLFMSNRPLSELKVRKMENILATEEEVMLDLVVGAINPNALSVSIIDMDLNVFAFSKHLGPKQPLLTTSATSSQAGRRRERRSDTNVRVSEDLSSHWHTPASSGGVDHGTDPIPDDGEEADTQSLLLGRILHFDVPLTFESQVFSRRRQYSTGTLQLMKPGNKTESGGSARWQKVLLHSFELTVRGMLIYQLPVSTKTQSVAVEASVLVHPEEGVDTSGKMRIEPVRHDERWQWIDWDDVVEDGNEEEQVV